MMKQTLSSGMLIVFAVLMCVALSSVDALAAANLGVTKQAQGGPFKNGDNIDFDIVVTNTGTVPFVAVEVIDATAPACYRFFAESDFMVINNKSTLDPGDQISYTCTKFNVRGDFSNSAVATGFTRDAGGCLVGSVGRRSPTIAVEVASPGIKIVKRAPDGTDVQTILPGDDAVFQIIVTNTGDVDLVNVVVTDPLAPACQTSFPSLLAGQSVSYTCTVQHVFSAFRNVARVTAGAPTSCPGTVTASDTSDVRITSPQCNLEVRKTARPDTIDASATDHNVTYTYVINNFGNAVSNVRVMDDKLGQIATGFSLASGGSQTFSTVVAVNATTTNTVTVTADLDGSTPPQTCHATGTATVTVTSGGKTFSIGPSSMEGAIRISNGDWVNGGYSFKTNFAQPQAFTVNAKVTITGPCSNGGTDTVVIPLGSPTYNVPAGQTDWLPTGDANSVLSWEGSVRVGVTAPSICGGLGTLDASRGAVFTTTVSASPGEPGAFVTFRFKYRDPAAKGKPNTNCLDTSDPNRNKADVCGASWSQTVTVDP